MPRYCVTLITTDELIGSNPGHHTGIILSRQEHEKAPFQSVGAYGYYGVPSSTRTGLGFWLKRQTGLDVDLVGNHGWLKSEELYFLDRGYGVLGATKELSETQFKALEQDIKTRLNEQAAAVREWTEEQKNNGREIKRKPFPRLYPEEQHSEEIYRSEKQKSAGQCRLKEFEFGSGVTCHYQALSLLKNHVQDDKWLASLGHEQKVKQSIPRVIEGVMSPVHLFGLGNLKPFLNGVAGFHRKGVLAHNRVYHCEQDTATTVIWALPPAELLKEHFSLEVIQRAQTILPVVMGLYWLFADFDTELTVQGPIVEEKNSPYKFLRQYITAILQAFSVADLSQGLQQATALCQELQRAFLAEAYDGAAEIGKIHLGEDVIHLRGLHNLPDAAKRDLCRLLGLRQDKPIESTCTREYIQIAYLNTATNGLEGARKAVLAQQYLGSLPEFSSAVFSDEESAEDESLSSDERVTSSDQEQDEAAESEAWSIEQEQTGLIELLEKRIAYKTHTRPGAPFASQDSLSLFARGVLPRYDTVATQASIELLIKKADALQTPAEYEHKDSYVSPAT